MASRFGAARGAPDYDRFRTGLSYKQVRAMADDRKYRRRGTVLGVWNQIKREMWMQLTGQRL
jgi:hypothetical protein